MSFPLVVSVGNSLSQYFLDGEQRTLQKDGQQYFEVTIHALLRLSVLAEQMTPLLETVLSTEVLQDRCTYLQMGLILTSLFIPSSCFEKLNFLKPIIDQNNRIINVVCLVSYVSLIAFGFPVQGGIALVGLSLTLLKQNKNNWLSPRCDAVLRPLAGITLMITGAASPFFLVKLSLFLRGFSKLSSTLYHALQLEKTWIPGSHPFHGLHQKEEEISAAFLAKGEKNTAKWLEELDLRINKTYVYSDYLETLLPALKDEDKDYSALLDRLLGKMQECGVILEPEEVAGLEEIKDVLLGTSQDDPKLLDVDKFRETVAHHISSILQDEIDFETKIREFAFLGKSCKMGWNRDAKFLLQPQTKDASWSVHYELAVARSEHIEEAICQWAENSGRKEWFGKSNNTHLTTDLQMAMYATYRTYDAEMRRQQFYSFFSNVCFRYLQTSEGYYRLRPLEANPIYSALKTIWNLGVSLAGALHFSILLSYVPGVITLVEFYQIMKRLQYTPLLIDPEALEKRICEALNPEEQIIKKDQVTYKIYKRRISQETIDQDWAASFRARYPDFGLDDFFSDNPYYYKDISDGQTLTQLGVRLMLWDMGILTLNPELGIQPPWIAYS